MTASQAKPAQNWKTQRQDGQKTITCYVSTTDEAVDQDLLRKLRGARSFIAMGRSTHEAGDPAGTDDAQDFATGVFLFHDPEVGNPQVEAVGELPPGLPYEDLDGGRIRIYFSEES